MNKDELNKMYDQMAANWPSDIIARRKVEEFTGGILSGKTLANIEADENQVGPPKIKVGRLVGYPKGPFMAWLKARTTIPPVRGKSEGPSA